MSAKFQDSHQLSAPPWEFTGRRSGQVHAAQPYLDAAVPPDGATNPAQTRTRTPAPRIRLRIGSELAVTAEHVDAAGFGIARTASGCVVRVQGLLSGESAAVEITARRQGLRPLPAARDREPEPEQAFAACGPEFYARVRTRHSASAERVTPSCAGYGRCGGCVLQHLAYDAQLRMKHELVQAELAASGLHVEGLVDPVTPSPSPLGYRSRVKLVAAAAHTSASASAAAPAATKDGPGATPRVVGMLGAYAPRSHEVIDMAGCRTNERALQSLARLLRDAARRLAISAYDEASGRGALRYVLLRSAASGALQLSLVLADALPEPILAELLAELLAKEPRLSSVVLHRNQSRGNALLSAESETLDDGEAAADRVLHGESYLDEELGPVRVRLSARSFSQVNRAVAVAIYRAAAQAALDSLSAAAPLRTPGAAIPILDLYCGVGGLGLTILALAGERALPLSLLGIESSASAVADATAAAASAGLSPEQARFDAAEVETRLPELLRDGPPFQVIVVNPPRRGLTSGVLSAFAANPPPCLIYVSCSPRSLARDALALTAAGLRLSRVTPFDMHPGTSHVETLAVFHRQAPPL